jgi:hypothetical protein
MKKPNKNYTCRFVVMGFYTTLNLTMHVVETNTFLKPHLMLCVVLGCSMTGKITISVAKTGKYSII